MQQVLFGTDEPVAAARELRAGRLCAQLRGTRLGPITFDGHEIWHGIDFLFRDVDWGTPRPVVDRTGQHADEEAVRLTVHGRIGAGIAFEIAIRIAETSLDYAVTATVQETLQTNRTGLVVMHPLSACTRRVEVEHTDGRTSTSTFPGSVAPWPPFTLVRAIRHEYADGAWATCRFSGDDFELEDQRNNADASFKTYSRSNFMPRPYRLRAGMVLRQSVRLQIASVPATPHVRATDPVSVAPGGIAGPLPAIGVAVTAADLHRVDAGVLAELAPAYLHLVLERADEPFEPALLARLLAGRDLRLDVCGVTAADAQLGRIADRLRSEGIQPAAVAVFPSEPAVLAAARRAFPHADIGGGTPHFFTQLNRIEDLGAVDFLAFGTASVVHGADDEEIMAGLQSLPAMIETLRVRHGAVPVHVGPSSIGARRSPLGAQPASDGSRRLALARRDPRTRGLYGAAWAVGYIAQFARAGARAVTLFDLAGDAALVGEDGVRSPAFHVLRRLGAPARCRHMAVPADASLAVLGLQHETILANLGAQPLAVRFEAAQAQVMDAQALLQHADDPWRRVALHGGLLVLDAFAVAILQEAGHTG